MNQDSLDNVALTSDLCTRLFKDGITSIGFTAREKEPEIPFSGNNAQNILVVTDVPGKLKSDDQNLLDNLLKACNLASDDIAHINIREQEASIPEILKRLHIKKAIFFGVPSQSINLPVGNSEESVIIYDNMYILKTSPLSSLQHNVAKKKALWAALKNMFGL